MENTIEEPSLPKPKRIITGHNSEGQAIVQFVDEGHWTNVGDGSSKWNVFWATKTFPVDITHDESLETEIVTGSLTLPNGTVVRLVDRAPHSSGPVHRTQSLDYGFMIEGEAELLCNSGDRITMRPGDVCIQRSTMHQWINNTDKWNRMAFVLMDAEPIKIGDQLFQGEVGLNNISQVRPRADVVQVAKA